MTINPHGMSHGHFIALAQGGGGIEAVTNLVAAQRSKHMIMLHGLVKTARSGKQRDDQLAVAAYEVLIEVQRHDPDAVSEVISYPSVGAWAMRTLRGDNSVPGARLGGLGAIAAAAAIRAGIAVEITVPVIDGSVVLPSLGAAAVEGATAAVEGATAAVEGATAVVRTCPAEVRANERCVQVASGAPGWRELRPIRVGSLDVLVDDLDPFRMPAADGEPMKRLAPSQISELAQALRDAWAVLDPVTAAEIASLVRVVVPCQAPESGYVSTSSAETFGTVGMSLRQDRYTCAETLVHEAQHLKLSALLDLVRLTRGDDGRRYYAPWRSDPRPASALLQGTYAFLGVAGFWRRQRQAAAADADRLRADAEFARWRDGSALAADTLLTSGQLTSAGQDFVGEMARLLGAWRREWISPEALAIARRKASLHIDRWREDNEGGAASVTSPGLA